MRNLVLALLLLPVTAIAQYEDHPGQQMLWEGMTNMAPGYEMLLACERDYTAELVYKNMTQLASTVVQNRRDIDIAFEMWQQARKEASMQYYDTIRGLERNPEGEACNNLESRIIQILDAGV